MYKKVEYWKNGKAITSAQEYRDSFFAKKYKSKKDPEKELTGMEFLMEKGRELGADCMKINDNMVLNIK